ncbi:MAG: porin [Odoribacter sp.]
MKKLILSCTLIFAVTPFLFAQHLDFQSNPNLTATSLFEKITKLEKKTDRFNLYMNMQGSFNTYFSDNNVNETAFRMNQLRLEIKGNITDRIYYRYRQRLNRSNSAQSLDNLPTSIDYAAVGFHITHQLAVFAGKQCTAFGGFEFDLNPIEVYQYCDMLEYMSNFLTGIDFSYLFTPQQELRFQILDSRNGSFESLYGTVPDHIKRAKTPLGYTLNWNGNFWDNQLKTRWSASIFHEAKKQNWYYYALGTEVSLSKFIGFFDFMYSNEDIDRTGIISEIIATDDYDARALNTRYMSCVLHLNYRILPKLNLFAKGMYETASVRKANQVLEKGKYRTSWGYIAGCEYYPMKENLHFFLNYIGRSYDYTKRAKVFGVGNSNPQRVELGLVYQLPMF